MPKVLIIEDDVDTSRLMGKLLSQNGYQVLAAIDAYQGINLIRKERPDLVILDLKMPAGGGIGVLKSIRSSMLFSFTTVVVVTASDDQELKKQVTELGVQGYVQKPFKNELLLQVIRNALDNKT